MKKITLILLILYGTLTSGDLIAQSGGRKREHRNQKRASSRMFKKGSAGNADSFAKGGRRHSGKKKTAWAMRHSKPGTNSANDQRSLFSRYRTKGKVYRHNILAKQNNERAKKRIRGSKVFHRKKFF